jgi:hypothetical protein
LERGNETGATVADALMEAGEQRQRREHHRQQRRQAEPSGRGRYRGYDDALRRRAAAIGGILKAV